MFRSSNKNSFLSSSIHSSSSFGLEISDDYLKFTELVNTKNGVVVGKYGGQRIPAGVIEDGEIIEPQILEKILTDLRKKEGLKSAHVSLPDEQIHVLKLKINKLGVKNIKQGIGLALEHNIPLSEQVFIFDYKLLNEDTYSWDVQAVVIAKHIMDGYVSIFKNSKISILSFESRAQATAKILIKKGDKETHMIVDLGEKRIGISFVSDGITMLDSIVNANDINLLENIYLLREEISKHFLFWHTNKDQDEKVHPPVVKIILCGEGDDLNALADYLSSSLKHQVVVADVWFNILDTEKNIPVMSFKQSLTFAVPLGLALKGVK